MFSPFADPEDDISTDRSRHQYDSVARDTGKRVLVCGLLSVCYVQNYICMFRASLISRPALHEGKSQVSSSCNRKSHPVTFICATEKSRAWERG